MQASLVAYLALIGRIFFLGFERIVLKEIGKTASSASVICVVSGLSALLILPFLELPSHFELHNLIIPFTSALIYSFGLVAYSKSLSLGEVSKVSPLYSLSLFFLMLLSVAFLGESFSGLKILGLVVITCGVGFLNKQSNLISSFMSIFRDRACQLMILASFLMAIGRVIDGFAMKNFPSTFYAVFLNATISIYLALHLVRTGKKHEITDLIKERPLYLVVGGTFIAFSYLFMLVAFSKLEVSIVEPASVLGSAVTVFLSKFFFGEKIQDRMVAVLVMVLGTLLLFI